MDPHDLERALSFQFVRPEKITRNDVAWLMNTFVPAAVEELRRDLALQRQLDKVDEALPPWEARPDSDTGVVGRVQTIENLKANRAERDRALEALRVTRELVEDLRLMARFVEDFTPLSQRFLRLLRDVYDTTGPVLAARAVLGKTDD